VTSYAIRGHREATVDALAVELAAAIERFARRPFSPTDSFEVELAGLGLDSLTVLRIIAELTADPTLELDPIRLADVFTVAELYEYLVDILERVESND
jgi:acyl carrier protein